MEKNTLEKNENDYKEAIRNKYRIEKAEGKHSHYLNNPSQALLRDLCWEIFSSNPKDDDLRVYRNFFRTEFSSEENTSTKYTDKFRKVGWFYKGEKKPANISTVELAAILVDFQPRPFSKFRKEIGEEELKLIKELRDTNFSTDLSGETKDIDIKKEEPKDVTTGILTLIPESPTISPPIKVKKKLLEIIYKRSKPIIIATILVFSLVAMVIYFAFFKNHCMQWSEDHYEVVDCSTKDNGNFNVVIPLDESLLDFRKLKACDTTTCFMKNGEAFVWYGKTSEGVDFFNDNGNGKHPETKATLRPVTHYMFNKYLKGKPCQ